MRSKLREGEKGDIFDKEAEVAGKPEVFAPTQICGLPLSRRQYLFHKLIRQTDWALPVSSLGSCLWAVVSWTVDFLDGKEGTSPSAAIPAPGVKEVPRYLNYSL